VFLVDDHELIRAGIRAEIADSVDIVGEADEVEAAIEMILERTPDVVLLDVHMPDGGGQAVLRAVGEHETTSSASFAPALGATSPRTSPDRTSWTRSTESLPATSSSHLVWPALSSTPSAPDKMISPSSSPTRTSTN
jgi:CheY-like chemotaxis protein